MMNLRPLAEKSVAPAYYPDQVPHPADQNAPVAHLSASANLILQRPSAFARIERHQQQSAMPAHQRRGQGFWNPPRRSERGISVCKPVGGLEQASFLALLALAPFSSPAGAVQTKPGSLERAVECINARAQCVANMPPSFAAAAQNAMALRCCLWPLFGASGSERRFTRHAVAPNLPIATG